MIMHRTDVFMALLSFNKVSFKINFKVNLIKTDDFYSGSKDRPVLRIVKQICAHLFERYHLSK